MIRASSLGTTGGMGENQPKAQHLMPLTCLLLVQANVLHREEKSTKPGRRRDACLSTLIPVHSSAPPERIVHPVARSLDLQFRVSEHAELRCEVSPAGSRVRWFKDGLEVEVSEGLKLGAKGPVRTLTLPHIQHQDTGEYMCETRDEAVTFNVSVAGECGSPRNQVRVAAGPRLMSPVFVQNRPCTSSPLRQPLTLSV